MTETNIQLYDVVERIFSNWTALRMAVEHGMGSSAHARDFCEFIAQTFSLNEQLHYTDIAIELEDYMDSQFNTRLEDDSEKQVAEEIVRFHRYIAANEIETLQTEFAKLPSLQPWIQGFKMPKPVNMDESDSTSDSDAMDSDSDINNKNKSDSGMEVDSDGWSVVRRKK